MWYIAGIPIVEHNRGLIISEFLFTPLAFLAVTLRLFSRGVVARSLGVDDLFVTAAALGTIGFVTAAVHQIKYGLGDAVYLSVLQNFLQALLATIIAYNFTQLSVKFSILILCKRIFYATSAQRIFTGLTIWLSLYGAFCLVASIITCWPVEKYWDDSIPGRCMNRSNLHYVIAGFNILNDILIVTAPLPYLRNLNITRKFKLILIVVFSCGGFTCIVAVIRLHSLYVFNSAPIHQQPIKGVQIAIWSGLEINISIICACVPALKPLFIRAFPRFLSSLGHSKRSNPHSSTHGNLPLDSIGHQDPQPTDIEDNGIVIRVHQSFQMQALPIDRDDASDKNLVPDPRSSTWTTSCSSAYRNRG
ncbi:hypothetical protein ACJ41O_008861 [Fusarium nematophilum]